MIKSNKITIKVDSPQIDTKTFNNLLVLYLALIENPYNVLQKLISVFNLNSGLPKNLESLKNLEFDSLCRKTWNLRNFEKT